ncbi:carbohydrate ABC transporter permease [Occultella aeris]|nr:sugar ABC transporter permease [Occultella aeris]
MIRTLPRAASDRPRLHAFGARKSRLRRKEGRAGLLLAGPGALHVLIWVGLPMVVALVLSFTRYDIPAPPEFIGVDNYVEAFTSRSFQRAVLNTLFLTIVAVPTAMIIALVIAVLLNQGMRWQGFFRTAVFLPHITATVAVAVLWLWIFNPDHTGLLNRIIGTIGLGPVSWLGSTEWAMPSVIVMYIWQSIGIKMLIYLAALQGLPPEVGEAARLDGANSLERFWYMTVPLLRPATFFVLVISVISSFQVFDQIYILTSGGPANATTVMTYQIYQSAFQASRMGYASAQSIVLFVVLIILAIVSRRIVGGTDAH